MDTQRVVSILEKHTAEKSSVIAILEAIQNEFRYLPFEALKLVAEKTGRPFTEIYGVATFYKAFSLKPKGRHVISVCVGTACHVRGAPRIVEEFEKELKIKAGDNTPDNEFTLDTVNCLGACAIGPVVVVDGHFYSQVRVQSVRKIIEKAKSKEDKINVVHGEKLFPIRVNCPHCNHSLMDSSHPVDGYPSINITAAFERDHGFFRLSCLYGSFNVETEHEIPLNTLVHFFCPHCHSELISSANCMECGAPLFPMIVQGGGMIQECSRRGCPSHRLDLDGVNL